MAQEVTHFQLYDLRCYANEWRPLEDVRDMQPARVEISGKILEETADIVKVAVLWDSETNDFHTIYVIPKGSIYNRSDKGGR